MPTFIPGIELNEALYREVVRPILDEHHDGVAHSAALIGGGSDVIGFDTPLSCDHDWGPRLLLFLDDADVAAHGAAIHESLRQHLPTTFRGVSTHFGASEGGVRQLKPVHDGPVEHGIRIGSIEAFWQRSLGIHPNQDPQAADWLTFAGHSLLTLTGGRVYHDALGLERLRERYRYYPHDVWLYLLAAQWALISQEEAFVGRAWHVGDRLGSRIIATRQVERLMHLCFLLERRYAPYGKWLGTGFQRLEIAERMAPLLQRVLDAADYETLEVGLSRASSLAVEVQNALGITAPLDASSRRYHDRPYQVIFAERIVAAIYERIRDPAVLALPRAFGSIDQFMVASSDARQDVAFTRGLKDHLGRLPRR